MFKRSLITLTGKSALVKLPYSWNYFLNGTDTEKSTLFSTIFLIFSHFVDRRKFGRRGSQTVKYSNYNCFQGCRRHFVREDIRSIVLWINVFELLVADSKKICDCEGFTQEGVSCFKCPSHEGSLATTNNRIHCQSKRGKRGGWFQLSKQNVGWIFNRSNLFAQLESNSVTLVSDVFENFVCIRCSDCPDCRPRSLNSLTLFNSPGKMNLPLEACQPLGQL